MCNPLFVVACHSVCRMFYRLLLAAACRTCSHSSLRALQFALFATQSSIIWGKLGAVNCLATGSTSNHNGLSDKVHSHKLQLALAISIMFESERPVRSSNFLGCPIFSQISMYPFKQVERACLRC